MVCRTWHQLVFDGSLWSIIDMHQFYKSIPIECLLKFIHASGPCLRIANFRGCIQLTGHALRTLVNECPFVETLIIKDCRGLSAASINYLLQQASQLKILDVSGLDSMKPSIVPFKLDKLQKLNMSWCRHMTGKGICFITQSCSQLTYLKLNGCAGLDETTMATLGRQLPSLVYLSLATCTSLTDASLLAFVEHRPLQLTHLNLSNCTRLTDGALRSIAIYTSSLTHLELSGCVLLSDQGFSFLCIRLQTLEYMDLEDIQQITSTTVLSIANHQPHLKHLCLSNCTHISDEAIIRLVSACRDLNHLELDNCNVSDVVLQTMADHLVQSPKYFHVQVLDCSHITESGIQEALTKASPMLTIKSFYSSLEPYHDSIVSRAISVHTINRTRQSQCIIL
ncbi:hypothetical protein CU098_003485 [Rhizopus stolonifer]|uniref:F-box/LRR-repeat protein 15-like leucin rich repeat domain-containing protein n=1 Tax=Rhizopus stolonifer TaxID=4846 RepID=A0A367JL82_RHIST|nr:hypothetical protein CU098_003485 [Rhizopus stolonifer]